MILNYLGLFLLSIEYRFKILNHKMKPYSQDKDS